MICMKSNPVQPHHSGNVFKISMGSTSNSLLSSFYLCSNLVFFTPLSCSSPHSVMRSMKDLSSARLFLCAVVLFSPPGALMPSPLTFCLLPVAMFSKKHPAENILCFWNVDRSRHSAYITCPLLLLSHVQLFWYISYNRTASWWSSSHSGCRRWFVLTTVQMRFQPLFAPYQADGTQVKDIHVVLCVMWA